MSAAVTLRSPARIHRERAAPPSREVVIDGPAYRGRLIARGQIVPGRWCGEGTWMPWVDKPTMTIEPRPPIEA